MVLPINTNQKATVNDGAGADLTIYGTLRQINNNINGGIQFAPSALATVMTGGIVELAANGSANDWAGNTHFDFQHGSIYLHNTSQNTAMDGGIFFPNAASAIPVFRMGSAAIIAGTTITINGVFEISANKSFTLNTDAAFIP